MNSAPSRDHSAILPDSIVRTLQKLIRRVRNLIIIRGLCASSAAGIGTLLVVMSIDAGFTILANWPRWLMTITAFSAWAGCLFWFLIRPLAHSFTLAGIARLIEMHHPELQERLSSVVELLGSQDIPAIRGSEVLIGALTEEAVKDALALRPKREISFRGAIPFAVAAGLVITLLAVLWLAKPRQTQFLLARAVAPFLNLPNIHAANLFVEPGDTLIASGSRLRISVRTTGSIASSARLLQMDRQGRETGTDMMAAPQATNLPGHSYAVTLPSVLTGFRYRILAGNALTRYFTVQVAIPPVIKHLDLCCRYPDYSRLGIMKERDGSGSVHALAGSEVTISTLVNKPVSAAVMSIVTASSTNTIKGVTRSTGEGLFYDFRQTMPQHLEGSWSITLTDEIGLANTPFEYSIHSVPDNPPVAAILNLHQRELHLNRDSRLPATYSAEDDLGLTGLALVFTVSGTTNEIIRPFPLPASQAEHNIKALRGETQIAMNDPLFAAAPRLAFCLRATDNLPTTLKGPQSGNSDTFTIVFDEQAASWKEQVLASQEDRIQEGLKEVQQKLSSAREQARALTTPLAKQPTLNSEAAKKVDALQDSLASTDTALRNIAADIDKGFFAKLATNIAVLAEEHVSKAENQAGQLRLVDTPAERTALHSNVTAEIDTSLRAIDQAIKDHAAAKAAVRNAVTLDRLAEKQEALAHDKQGQERAITPPASNAVAEVQATAASNAWQKAQERVADQLATLAKETPGTADHVAATTSNLAVQASSQAAKLAARQEELASLTQKQMEKLQNQNREWHELAARQDQLAALARNEPSSARHAPPMQQAARDLSAGKYGQAIQTQAEVADALRKEASRLMDKPAPPSAPTAPNYNDAHAMAAEALQKTENELKQAREAIEAANHAAENAQKRADSDAALVKRAGAAKKPDLVRVFTQQASESRQDAGEARQWSQIAKEAADQAKRAATDARSAAAQTERQDQSETIRKEAAQQATLAAKQVEKYANEARDAAHQAIIKSEPRNSMQDRAVQAEKRAADAAREASQSALKTGMTAKRARQDADQAEKRAEQAAANGTSPQQIKATQEQAMAAKAQAEAVRDAATKSRSEAATAHQAAYEAQKATDNALKQNSPEAIQQNTEAAENAADAAEQAAKRAEEQTRLANEATSPQRPPHERAVRAAEQAAQQAAAADRSAAEAQQAAQAMIKPVAETQRLAKQAWQTGQNDLAKATGQKSRETREQAKRVQALSDTAQKIAAEAREAAKEAVNAERQETQANSPAEAKLMAEKAEQAAQQTGAKAAQAKALAEQAQIAAEPKAYKTRQAAKQAAQTAQAASSMTPALQQARRAAERAAQDSIDQAQQAADAADKANESSDWARDRLAALKLSNLAAKQEELNQKAKNLLAEKNSSDTEFSVKHSEQTQLNHQIDDLAKTTAIIHAQTDQVLARTQAEPQTGQAAREMAKAAQSSDRAAQSMQQIANQNEAPEKSPSPNRQQAAEQTRQSQQSAAKNLSQAAQSLQHAAQAMATTATPVAAPAQTDAQEALAQAYESARQTAASQQAAAAAQTAAQVAKAADKAAAEAEALGANARPSTLQTASSGGGNGQNETAQTTEDVPSFARRFGMKLQDWLQLHGELKEDVLQAAGSEGPEEYRPLIKRYFREVSGHGGEE